MARNIAWLVDLLTSETVDFNNPSNLCGTNHLIVSTANYICIILYCRMCVSVILVIFKFAWVSLFQDQYGSFIFKNCLKDVSVFLVQMLCWLWYIVRGPWSRYSAAFWRCEFLCIFTLVEIEEAFEGCPLSMWKYISWTISLNCLPGCSSSFLLSTYPLFDQKVKVFHFLDCHGVQ